MAQNYQLPFSWLGDLSNAHHDGTSQQIDDFALAFATNNQVFIAKRNNVHTARVREDEVWLKSQRDPTVKLLEGANKVMDNYIGAFHYIISGHACLPEGEPTREEARECLQIMRDYKFKTTDTYGAESDKIIQMEQNLQSHQAFLTQIGAWTFFTQAVAQANLVRQYLGERAKTKGEFVKGEMKAARKATDQAIADLYVTVVAMMDLMPSDELTNLYNQLKGLELYARQYYLKDNHAGSGSGSNSGGGTSGGGDGQQGGDTPDPGTGGGDTPDPGTGGGGDEPVVPDPNPGGGGSDPDDPNNSED